MRVKYSANNSGGRDWLSSHDWQALEDAGWDVEWGGLAFCSWRREDIPEDQRCEDEEKCPGHRRALSQEELDGLIQKKGRTPFGWSTTHASVESETPEEAIRAFEKVTGQDASDEGCTCCGPPHTFKWGSYEDGTFGCVSGCDIAGLLTGVGDLTHREALERIKELEGK